MRNAESELSMLQRIAAQRILDYQVLVDDKEDHGGRNDWRKLHEEMVALEERLGPRLNLLQVIQSQSPNMALAAEFKRASPSKGNIAVDLDAGEQAVRYYTAGACIISVLTEQHWFKGSLSDLTKAREETQRIAKAGEERVMMTTTRPAILRKDFIITTYMILEAAAAGADTVLLIVAVTPANVLRELIQFSRSIGMEPLVEVHTEEELDVALTAGARVIGVNNRNLHTFQLDLATTVRTAEYLRTRGLQYNHNELRTSTSTEIANTSNSCYYSLCALSGMSTAEDVQRYRDIGVGMCLIGESLMRAPDPAAAIASLCLNPSNYQNRVLNNDDDSSSYSAAYTGGTKIIKKAVPLVIDDNIDTNNIIHEGMETPYVNTPPGFYHDNVNLYSSPILTHLHFSPPYAPPVLMNHNVAYEAPMNSTQAAYIPTHPAASFVNTSYTLVMPSNQRRLPVNATYTATCPNY